MNRGKFIVIERWHGSKNIVGLHLSDCYYVKHKGRKSKVKYLPPSINDVEEAIKWVKDNYGEYEKHFGCRCLKV